jgi:cyclase
MRALLLGAGLLVASVAHGQASVDTTLKREQLGDGIYLFRAPSDLDLWTATNVVVIVNDDDVTVFDSNTRPSTTRQVIAGIRAMTGKPVRTLINSHWHMDHWSGNDEYAKAYPGIRIIATTQSRAFMKRMGPAFYADEAGAGLIAARAALDTAIRTGKQRDGTPLTSAARAAQEKDLDVTEKFAKEMGAVPRVLPNLVFDDSLIFWSGRREFRLYSTQGDATGTAVLYLPAERLLVTGDALVSPEDGKGPPPWTTTSYVITPWLASLRGFDALDVSVIVPGQGPAMHGKAYLELTIELYAAILAQVHAALERGVVTLGDVQSAVNVDAIGRQFTPGETAVPPGFKNWVRNLTWKAYQESLDGIGGGKRPDK